MHSLRAKKNLTTLEIKPGAFDSARDRRRFFYGARKKQQTFDIDIN